MNKIGFYVTVHCKLVFIALLGLALTSCSDNDEPIVVEEITEEDLVEVLATSLSKEDGGLAADLGNLLDELEEECGYTNTESLNDEVNGDDRSYAVDYDYSIEVICDDNGQLLLVDYDYTATREAQLFRLDITSTVVSEWELVEANLDYQLNGSYDYNGVEDFAENSDNRLESEITYSTTELTLSSGGDFLQGSFAISQAVKASDSDWSYEGTLTVIRLNYALIDISGFEFLYEVDLITGETMQVAR